MRKIIFGVAGFMVLASGSITMAATLQPLQGVIKLNGGVVQGAHTVKGGDIVTAGATGSATIVYADGCTLKVDPGTTVQVPAESTCNFAATDFLIGGGVLAAAVGGAIILTQDDDDKQTPASP